jgi:plasmid stabilization system protein ParE
MTLRVRMTQRANDDIERLSKDSGDIELSERALVAIKAGIETLRHSPFTCRKAEDSPFLRELIIPFSGHGYLALFDITDSTTVNVVAVRHQREDDYH